jgi:hypothetical protein
MGPCIYSKLIASTGHASTHTPQSTHASFTSALPSTILIASLGHSEIQDSQPVHLSLSTTAGIVKSFQIKISNKFVKEPHFTKKSRLDNIFFY